MPGTYFDATNAADLQLIPRALRDGEALPGIAAMAEFDVLDFYTQRRPSIQQYQDAFYQGIGYNVGNGVYIALLNFDPDPDITSSKEPNLTLTLKYVIAEVIAWRLSKLGENAALEFVQGAQTGSRKKSSHFHDRFPPGPWNQRLRRWDLRTPGFGL